MAQRRLLIDNDAFILLAGASLLEEAISIAGSSPQEARRLGALEFMLRKPSRSLVKYPAEVLSRALAACARVAVLEESPSREMLATLGSVTGVNGGEAVLFGMVAEHEFHYLASNDKTAMRAVAKDAQLAEIRAQVAGKVLCMELLVKRLIEKHGPKLIAQRFAPLLSTDKRLISIFSPATSDRPDDCLIAVNSFLQGLHNDLGEDFLFDE